MANRCSVFELFEGPTRTKHSVGTLLLWTVDVTFFVWMEASFLSYPTLTFPLLERRLSKPYIGIWGISSIKRRKRENFVFRSISRTFCIVFFLQIFMLVLTFCFSLGESDEQEEVIHSETRRESATEDIIDSSGRPLFGGLKALQSESMPAQTSQLQELNGRSQLLVQGTLSHYKYWNICFLPKKNSFGVKLPILPHAVYKAVIIPH